MKIDKNNIEEVIFDFFEGNLKDADKSALMNFLHLNPEFEREFVLWAKTYHTEKEITDYGHDESFYQKVSFVTYYKWVGMAASITLILGIYFWPQNKPKKEYLPEVKINKAEKVFIKSEMVKKTRVLKPTIKAGIKMISNPDSFTQNINIGPIAVDTIKIIPEAINQSSIQDSIPLKIALPATNNFKDSSLPAIIKEKKKRRKLNLIPTDNVLPFNSDF